MSTLDFSGDVLSTTILDGLIIKQNVEVHMLNYQNGSIAYASDSTTPGSLADTSGWFRQGSWTVTNSSLNVPFVVTHKEAGLPTSMIVFQANRDTNDPSVIPSWESATKSIALSSTGTYCSLGLTDTARAQVDSTNTEVYQDIKVVLSHANTSASSVTLVRTGASDDFSATIAPLSTTTLDLCMEQSFRNNLTNYFDANGSSGYDDVLATKVEREHTLVRMEDGTSSTNRFMTDQSQAGLIMVDDMTSKIESQILVFEDTSAAKYLYDESRSVTLTYDKATVTLSSGLIGDTINMSVPYTNVIDSVSAFLGYGSYDQSEADIRDGFTILTYTRQSRNASMTMSTSGNNDTDFAAGLSVAHLSIANLADDDNEYASVCAQLNEELVMSLTPGTYTLSTGDGRLSSSSSSIMFSELKYTDVADTMSEVTDTTVSVAFDVDAYLTYTTSTTITSTYSSGSTATTDLWTADRSYSLADSDELLNFTIDLTTIYDNASITSGNRNLVNDFSVTVTNLFDANQFENVIVGTPYTVYEKNEAGSITYQQSAASGVTVTGTMGGDDSLNYYIKIGSHQVKFTDMERIDDASNYTTGERNNYLADLGDATSGDLTLAYDESRIFMSVSNADVSTTITTSLQAQSYVYAVIQDPTSITGGLNKIYISSSSISVADAYLDTTYNSSEGAKLEWTGFSQINAIRSVDDESATIVIDIRAVNNDPNNQVDDADNIVDFVLRYTIDSDEEGAIIYQSGSAYNQYSWDSGNNRVTLPVVFEHLLIPISFELDDTRANTFPSITSEVSVLKLTLQVDTGYRDIVHVLERVRPNIDASDGGSVAAADSGNTTYTGTLPMTAIFTPSTVISCANSTAGTDYLVTPYMPTIQYEFPSATLQYRARHLDQEGNAMRTTDDVSQLFTSEAPTIASVAVYSFESIDNDGTELGEIKINGSDTSLNLITEAGYTTSDGDNTYSFVLNTDDLNMNGSSSNFTASVAITAEYYTNYLDNNDFMYIYNFTKSQVDISVALIGDYDGTILESAALTSQHLGADDSVTFFSGLFNVALTDTSMNGSGQGHPATFLAQYETRGDLSVGYNVSTAQMYGRSYDNGDSDTHDVQYNGSNLQTFVVARNSRDLLSITVSHNAGNDEVVGGDAHTAPDDSLNIIVSSSQIRYSFYDETITSVSQSYNLNRPNGTDETNVLSVTIVRAAGTHTYGDFYYLENDETNVVLPKLTLGDKHKIQIDESDNNVASATSRSSVTDFQILSSCGDRLSEFVSTAGITSSDIGDLYNILYQIRYKSPLHSDNQANEATSYTMFVNPDRVTYVDYYSESTQTAASTTLFNLNPSSTETLKLLNTPSSRKQLQFNTTIPGAHRSTVDNKAMEYFFINPRIKIYTWVNTFGVAMEESVNQTFDVLYNGETLLNDNLSGSDMNVVGYTANYHHKTGLRFLANQSNYLYDVNDTPGSNSRGTYQYYRDHDQDITDNVDSVAVFMELVTQLSSAGDTTYSGNAYELSSGVDFTYVSSGAQNGYIKIKEIVFNSDGTYVAGNDGISTYMYASQTNNNNTLDNDYNIFIKTIDEAGDAIYFSTWNDRSIVQYTLSGIKGDRFAAKMYVYRDSAWTYYTTLQDVVLYGLSQQSTTIDFRADSGSGNYVGIRVEPRLTQIESDESFATITYMKHYNAGEGFAIVTVSGPPLLMVQSQITDTIPTAVSLSGGNLTNSTSTAATLTALSLDTDLHLTASIDQTSLRATGLSSLSALTANNFSQNA